MQIKKLIRHLRVKGVSGCLESAVQRVRKQPCQSFNHYSGAFAGVTALEIGDRSPAFRPGGVFPVYPVLKRCDKLVHARNTEWDKTETNCDVHGKTIVGCGVKCDGIANNSYGAIISSHVLEHIANPLGAIIRWKDITAPGGMMLVIVPDHKKTFDWRRKPTSLDHLIWDNNHDTSEDSGEHIEEFVREFDHNMNLCAKHDPSQVAMLAATNRNSRIVHHHVWDGLLLARALDFAGLTVLGLECFTPHHIIAVAKKQL